jgi:hypothetical protein
MSTSTSRRRFIEIMPFAGVALLAACSPKVEPTSPAATMPPETPQPVPAPATVAAPAVPRALPMVNTKDALAVSLGYVDDAANADRVKYANYVPASQCSNCALYMGKAGEASGGCPLFQGQFVTAMGWCSSWVKKA